MIKQIISVILFLMISGTAFASGNASLCVYLKDSDRLDNMSPAEITANEKQIFWIISGETKCTDLAPGEYSIAAASANPFDPNNKKMTAWNSKPLAIHIEPYTRTKIDMHPVTQGAENAGLWVLEKRKEDMKGPIASGIFLFVIIFPLLLSLFNERIKERLSLKWADESGRNSVPLSRRSIFAFLLFAAGFIPCYILEDLRNYNLSWYPFLWFVPSFLFAFISAVIDHRQAKQTET